MRARTCVLYGALALTGCGDHPPGATSHRAASPTSVIDVASFAEIPAGTFTMGCVEGDPACEAIERPAHKVTLTQPYFMQRYEVTVADFERFVSATGYRAGAERRGEGRMVDPRTGDWEWVRGLTYRTPFHPDRVAHPDWPAVQMEWADAAAYCRWTGGRLPTEAEWEYAARGGVDGERTAWGSATVPRDSLGTPMMNGPDEQVHGLVPRWEFFRGFDDGFPTLAPVGRFPPNRFGLHDMLGNAYEWTADAFDSSSYDQGPRRDPMPATAATSRVVRGGGWGYYPFHHRYSWRGYFEAADFWTATVGFRCVRDAMPDDPYPLWGELAPGSHRVGFLTREMVDSTRITTDGPRRIRYAAWYPAESAPVFRFARYAELYTSPPPLPGTAWQSAFARSWFPTADSAAVARLLSTPTAAAEGAAARPHAAPIILYAPGLGGTPLTHTVLLEFLASHGFLVVSVAARGPGGGEQGYDVPGLEAMTDDLQAVLRDVPRHLPADTTHLVAAGFSFGGSAAALLAMRLPHVRAVVSLDGSLTFADAHHLLAQARGFAPDRLRAPLLAIVAAEASSHDLASIARMHASPRTVVRFAGMEHHDVMARHRIVGRVTGTIPPASRRIFRTTAELVLAFLTAGGEGLPTWVGASVQHVEVGAGSMTWSMP